MRLATLFAGLLATALFAAPASARIWQKSWSTTGRPTIHVTTNDGQVTVHRGKAGAVSARIEYKVKIWGWSSEPREPLIDLQQNGDVVTIVAKERGSVVVFGGISEDFTIEVTVPEDCDLDVSSGDGSIEVDPGKGRYNLTTSDGHITVDRLRGEIRLVTQDGNISGEGLDGALEARSGDGRVAVNGRFDRLSVHSGDGRVDVTARQGSRPASPWSVTTTDGSLTMRIPQDLPVMLDAACGDGRLSVDLPVNVSGGLTRHTLRGQLNGGNQALKLRTTDGNLTIALAD
ncbi:MAG: DUF4097 family beta strand repeat protein [Candidatus Eisenbacteria bacterium]|nr:DUF4097 family beta strand repeat protein [Candidatus Eisenbacteria bacterium]